MKRTLVDYLLKKIVPPRNRKKTTGQAVSIRAFCFGQFNLGKKTAEVAKDNPHLKRATLNTYYTQWHRLDHVIDPETLKDLRRMVTHDPEARAWIINRLSIQYKISVEEAEAIILRPYGMHQIISGSLKKQREITKELELLDLTFNVASSILLDLRDEQHVSKEIIRKSATRFARMVIEEDLRTKIEKAKTKSI